ncbi:hypothetical protein HELRODRAFT_109714 [Helobdella robusta]|uniref:Anaphase-promoting complex subunit 4 WD40 domain-containing protein n=1 Tax=Helobdella robusta TaxID=6412 RepID=T1EEV9_HELRO|nr:hypothetical protein HELRODRAFT_109714 [Helobdella robusta]ESO09508.1 hypothetical protein HELRODRAFT_109714 [Helobdella robusta]
MSNEEVRVDCVQLTTNGRYVVTGSIQGPPQVWDMKSGELIRVMQGDDLNSTDLHLANGDSYLVGQVADQSQAPYTRTNTYTPVPHATSYRKLQIWDFNSGKPLEMKSNEFCTASCMMNDGERMIIGRTEKLGQGTTVVIWDILANEPIRHIFWPGFVGSFDDPLTYINLSKDNRYIIAGAQNSSDGTANYVMFDLTTTDFDRMPPNVISINANVETTTILENQEAVTGTRSGDLVIWSLKTGKALRQLAASSATNLAESAHQGEVTCVCLSKDGQYLVSSSTDGSLKIWNMEQEKLQRTLIGHRDEVWCCTISNDNELVVSGSRDQTIRLWRVEDGGLMASIQTGIDIFRVMLSNNKKTVVALADKFGARKLVMLQVVRTKIKSSGGGSRATSPMSTLAASDVNYRF